MPVYTLNTRARIFRHSEYGDRLIFLNAPVNPRDELGKIGVTIYRSSAALLYPSIHVKVNVIAENGTISEQNLHLNRKSFTKYLKGFDPEYVTTDKTNEQLVNHFNDITWKTNNLNSSDHDFAMQQSKAGANGLRHAGEHNQDPFNPWIFRVTDYLGGAFYSWLYRTTMHNMTGLKARFLIAGTEKKLLKKSELLAKRRYYEALSDIPSYQKHVADKGVNNPVSLADVPVTSKTNYIKPYSQKDWELHKDGKYPLKGKTDTSTGTTGKPTPWVRSAKEVDDVINTFQLAARIEFGDRPINYINSFALGQWATGMTVYEAMRRTGNVFTTGTNKAAILEKLEAIYAYEQNLIEKQVVALVENHRGLKFYQDILQQIILTLLNDLLDKKITDVKKRLLELLPDKQLLQFQDNILAIVEEVNKNKSQIVIAGYPPFLKDLIEFATQKGIDFSKYHARGIVGGQAISEALRDKLIKGGFTHVNSSYGASDLDINMGSETEFETRFRKAIERNPGLARELFGANKSLPMIFHFDPFNYHIECLRAEGLENELLFTCNRDDRSSQRIRYDLGDKGRVYAVSDILALLLKYGELDMMPKINLPILIIWGRESTIVYGGANVAFTELERALTLADVKENIVKSAFYSYEDADGKEQFEIWVELREGIEIPQQEVAEAFLRSVLVNMVLLNQDFHWQVDALDKNAVLPTMRFFTRHNSPISESDGVHKQVLVFQRGTTLPNDYRFPNDAAISQLTSIQKDALFVEALNNQILDISQAHHASADAKADKEKAPSVGLFRRSEEFNNTDDKKMEQALLAKQGEPVMERIEANGSNSRKLTH